MGGACNCLRNKEMGSPPRNRPQADPVKGEENARSGKSCRRLSQPVKILERPAPHLVSHLQHRPARGVAGEASAAVAAGQVEHLIMRAFVRLRRILASNEEIHRKLSEVEKKVRHHDQAIAVLFDEIRKLMSPPSEEPRERMGFHPGS